ncbi:hypothetical protein GQ607_013204 [Colletotrichum asianum]|uniref:Uncharacterized protein n=1 Tax=Colletotrichum asianum TaxID=702518 RepID=A0A8H3ZMT5_9PEZI|nr:hypothetical protein GQ607_013204 [Colletotrichum asianum]
MVSSAFFMFILPASRDGTTSPGSAARVFGFRALDWCGGIPLKSGLRGMAGDANDGSCSYKKFLLGSNRLNHNSFLDHVPDCEFTQGAGGKGKVSLTLVTFLIKVVHKSNCAIGKSALHRVRINLAHPPPLNGLNEMGTVGHGL